MKLHDFVEVDYTILLAASILAVFGILFIYSSGVSGVSTGSVLVSSNTDYIKQIIWASIGFIAALVLAFFNYRKLYKPAPYIYLGVLIVLVYTLFFGKTVNGAKSWLGFGSVGIQPSEFAKLGVIISLACYLDGSRKADNQALRFIIACVIVFVPMCLVLVQPDFGTSLVFIPILLTMTFIAGFPLRYVLYIVGVIAGISLLTVLPLVQSYILRNTLSSLSILSNARFVGFAAAGLALICAVALTGYLRCRKRYFFWISYGVSIAILSLCGSFAARHVLKPYQIMRLIVFIAPQVDPQGAGWNIIQSSTAIGSGGLFGKGYLQGTQSHYQYLPQQSTDFIFSIFSEEWGFVGGLLVFVLFCYICLRFLHVCRTSNDAFGANIAAGLAGMFIFHFVINVGMAMGIMPIPGIPLLFMSYGGSSMLCAMIGVGLVLSIFKRRHVYDSEI
jgi:rod shape determining protein RodA